MHHRDHECAVSREDCSAGQAARAGGGSAGANNAAIINRNAPLWTLSAAEFAAGVSVLDAVVRTKLAPSKSDARRLVESGGIYVNNRRVSDEKLRVRVSDAIEGRLFVLRKGAKENHVVKLAW